MVQRIREPFGKAGLIVAVIALVAALVGGAYAAAGLTGKQKKEVKKIAKKFAGKDGAQGPVGPQGAKGDKGDTGAAGADGTDGSNGLSVTGAAATAAECGGVAGGVKYTLDGTTTKICNGKNGTNGESPTIVDLAPGDDPECPEGGTKIIAGNVESYACNGTSGTGGGSYPETLPEGATATGFWEVQGEKGNTLGEFAIATISFPLPLESSPQVILRSESPTEEEEEKCPGSGSEPKAAPGVLCLYKRSAAPLELKVGLGEKFGAFLGFAKTNEGFGAWAVTAPEAP